VLSVGTGVVSISTLSKGDVVHGYCGEMVWIDSLHSASAGCVATVVAVLTTLVFLGSFPLSLSQQMLAAVELALLSSFARVKVTDVVDTLDVGKQQGMCNADDVAWCFEASGSLLGQSRRVCLVAGDRNLHAYCMCTGMRAHCMH
jgi:hypothetical protein